MKDSMQSDSMPLSSASHPASELKPVAGSIGVPRSGEAQAKRSAEATARLKGLFADDEPALQDLMHLELPRMGHEVTVCPDGNTAVAALERNTYDCIIVDLDMQGLSGIQVISKCKELSPDTGDVVLTGKGSFDRAVTALR